MKNFKEVLAPEILDILDKFGPLPMEKIKAHLTLRDLETDIYEVSRTIAMLEETGQTKRDNNFVYSRVQNEIEDNVK